MTILSLLNGAVAVFICAAALAYLFTRAKILSGWLAGLGGTIGSAMATAAGLLSLLGADAVSGSLTLLQYPLLVTPLRAVWVITFGLCGLLISLYNIHWHRHDAVKANGLLINLLLADRKSVV